KSRTVDEDRVSSEEDSEPARSASPRIRVVRMRGQSEYPARPAASARPLAQPAQRARPGPPDTVSTCVIVSRLVAERMPCAVTGVTDEPPEYAASPGSPGIEDNDTVRVARRHLSDSVTIRANRGWWDATADEYQAEH